MSELFVAVDGGNSKTDVLIADVDGTIRGFVRGPGSSPQTLGVRPALDLLDALIAQARADAGLPAESKLSRAEIYLAGVDLPEEVTMLTEAVQATGWAAEHLVDNDTFALMRAGTDQPDAVAVVCGAGINCVGRTADGRSARFPALGVISGDWGGGQHLASLALWHAARAEDGRGPDTALRQAVASHFGVDTVEQVVAGLHLGSLSRDGIDGLSEVMFTVAQGGDEVALRVVARQAREIVALVTVAADRLDLAGSPYAVVLGGGVLRADHRLLNDAISDGVTAHSPQASLSVVAHPPVLGAALNGLDALQARPEASLALRAALAETRPTISDLRLS